MHLNPVQLRVLGSLIEKEISTPENYPLSLNALQNACNQRSSREPVMDLDEEAIRQALHGLEEMALVTVNRDSRVAKFEHRARTVLNLRRDETAVLCLLFLRGPQTAGEIRSRADRLYPFDDLAAVQATLERLAARPATTEDGSAATGPLTLQLQRQPGSREARFAHLLGDIDETCPAPGNELASSEGSTTRLERLEAEVAQFSAALKSLAERLERLESSSKDVS